MAAIQSRVFVFLLLPSAAALAVALFFFAGLPDGSEVDSPLTAKGEEGEGEEDAGYWSLDPGYSMLEAGADRAGHETKFRRFDEWLAEFEHTPPAHRAALIARGADLARERRPVMVALIENDAEEALRRAVPKHLHRQLPEEIARHLEKPIDATGDYFISIACGFGATGEDPGSEIARTANLEGEIYRVFGGDDLSGSSRKNAFIRGIGLDGKLALASMDDAQPASDSTEEPSDTEESWTKGTKELLYIRIAFPDRPDDPLSLEEAYAGAEAAAAKMEEESHSLYNIEVTVVPEVVTLHRTSTDYWSSTMQTLRRDAQMFARIYDDEVESDGLYDANNYDLDIVAFEQIYPGFAASANIGAAGIWLNGQFDAALIAHELGHNLGLYHANAWRPFTEDPIGDGEHVEYGDPADLMGQHLDLSLPLNGWFKSLLQWIPSSDWKEVRESGAYRLYRHDLPDADGLRAIKVAPQSDRAVWLDFQHDSQEQNGIGLRWGMVRPDGSPDREGSRLLKLSGNTEDDFAEYALRIGEEFEEPQEVVRVRPIRFGGTAPHEFVDIELDIETPPAIVEHPEPRRRHSAESVTFAVEAEGGLPFTYRWYKDGEFFRETEKPRLEIEDLQTIDRGKYHVVVSSPYGHVESEPADLVVYPPGYRVPGSLDRSFDTGKGFEGWGVISALDIADDGMIVVTGRFTAYRGHPTVSVARIFEDGRVDTSFSANLGNTKSGAIAPTTQALQPDGRVLIAGIFDRVDGAPRPGFARLNADGSLDHSFDPGSGPNGRIHSILVQPDGRILIFGEMTDYDGTEIGYMCRLHPDGSLDESFKHSPGADGPIYSAIFNSNDQLVVGGAFDQIQDWSSSRVARLLSNGKSDERFGPVEGLKGWARHLYEASDGSLIVGGGVFYLAPDGRDWHSPFNAYYAHPTLNSSILSIRIEENCSLERIHHIRRHFSDGTIDPTFNNDAYIDSGSRVIRTDEKGRIYVSSNFSKFGIESVGPLVRLHGTPERYYFANWAFTNDLPPGMDSPADDPGDYGIPNLVRFAFGLDALSPDRSSLPVIKQSRGSSDSHPIFAFRRRRSAEDIDYIPEVSSDLQSWDPVPEEYLLSVTKIDQHWEEVVIGTAGDAGNERTQFFRVRVLMK